MLSKSLTQISIDGWSCVLSLLFTWGQTMVEVIKIMVTSIKRSHACTVTLSAPNPAAGHHQPTPPPETPGHSLASLGQSVLGSLLLSSGSCCIRFCCALQESTSQSCVSSGSSVVGLMVTSSKRAYATPKAAAPEPLPLWQFSADPYLHRRHSNTSTILSVSVGSLGPGAHKVCLSPLREI